MHNIILLHIGNIAHHKQILLKRYKIIIIYLTTQGELNTVLGNIDIKRYETWVSQWGGWWRWVTSDVDNCIDTKWSDPQRDLGRPSLQPRLTIRQHYTLQRYWKIVFYKLSHILWIWINSILMSNGHFSPSSVQLLNMV